MYLVHRYKQNIGHWGRTQSVQNKILKQYKDYDCVEIHRTGKLHKMYATELDKYIIYHHTEDILNLTKKQKLSWVEAHIRKELCNDLNNNF